MSLLLDALKKAADDKKKNSSGEDVSNSVIQTENSLDLELHINEEDNSPELDESALDTHDTHESHEEPVLDIEEMAEELTAAKKRKINDNNNHNTLDTNIESASPQINEPSRSDIDESSTEKSPAPDPVTPPANYSKTNKNETPINSAEFKQSNATEETTEPTSKPAKEELTLQDTSTTKTFNKTINNEHALSALINKSNHHSRSQKKRQLITIVSLIALIFIGAGLYFYIQFDTSNQDIYIPQSNQSNINRNLGLPERDIKNTAIKPQPEQPAVIDTPPVTETLTTHIDEQQTRNIITPNQTSIKPSRSKPVLSIVRTKKPDPVHNLLNSAYIEFNKQNYHISKKLYLQVLLRENNNRDALLGIAAIAIKESHYEVARQKYQFLLKLNPRDSLATAGLSSIQNLINPQLNASQLKFMIKQQPDSPHLYFALGSVYSVQNKWSEAQSAFFSAWSADNKNADYAYNLAVSLDHMNHPSQALNFYQLSLKLISGSNSNFSVEKTQRRISLLQGTTP